MNMVKMGSDTNFAEPVPDRRGTRKLVSDPIFDPIFAAAAAASVEVH